MTFDEFLADDEGVKRFSFTLRDEWVNAARKGWDAGRRSAFAEAAWVLKREALRLEEAAARGEGLMTTFICPPQDLPVEKVRQIVRDAGCDWHEDDSRESRLWRFNVSRIVNAAWHRGFADHAAVQRAGEEAVLETTAEAMDLAIKG